MSPQENVQTVKNFSQPWAVAINQVYWQCLPKISGESFRARIGRWQVTSGSSQPFDLSTNDRFGLLAAP